MKKLILVGVMLASSIAFARREDQTIRYQCQAAGSNRSGRMLIQGWERDTKAEARVSAVKVCREAGLKGCAVHACYERIW